MNIVWLRNDLRLTDNPALTAAIKATGTNGCITIVYILEETNDNTDPQTAARPLGAASRWWLHHCLESLKTDLHKIGGKLVLRKGNAANIIPALVEETKATTVFWNRRYSNARNTDIEIKATLAKAGCQAKSFQAELLYEPWETQTKQGTPYKVFTAYSQKCLTLAEPRQPLPAPTKICAPTKTVKSDNLEDWHLLPTGFNWAKGLTQTWDPGEQGANNRLKKFMKNKLANYHKRDQPAENVTSMLSPHLRFGEISPFTVWDAVRTARQTSLTEQCNKNANKFLSELAWREFNANVFFYLSTLPYRNVRTEFDKFPWAKPNPNELAAWKEGRTGIPIVDAGMRELWHTGNMHNRVRMVTASFLVKNLLVDWRIGEAWFWDTLVDASEASNPGNWQWVAGSGLDAAPYFRVFNPQLQNKKFDPDNKYVQRWVPEYGTGEYPKPIVDLSQTRNNALLAYETMRTSK